MEPAVKVLVVDDRPENLQAMSAILKDPQYDLLVARSGAEALRALLHDDFALVVLDVVMPDLDGFETAALMRGCERTRAIPIIFLTATTTDIDQVYRGYSVGAVDYLQKPADPDVLRAKVRVFVELYLSARRARQLERERTAREAAEAQLQQRDEFLSVASHELKTPLTPLKLQIQNLRRTIGRAGSDPEVARQLLVAERQVDRMAHLVEQLLDLSRLSAGRFQLERERFDLAELVRDAAARHELLFQRAGSSLTIEASAPVFGEWDRMRLDEVMSNLLSNACKFGEGRPVQIRAFGEGAAALVAVKDHGIGIAPDDHRRIFERFERVGNGRSIGGLGLGLYIAREIAHAHGGGLRVDSQPGEGATFTMELPREA